MKQFREDSTKTADMVYSIVDNVIEDLHTAIPGKIVSYDASKQEAEIQPLVRYNLAYQEDQVDIPPIANVPVQIPNCNGGQTYISLPLKVGDTGMLMFVESDWDLFLSSNKEGTIVDSGGYGRHQLKDAFFVPGVRPLGDPLQDVSDTDVLIKHVDALITLQESGKFSFENSGAELIDELIKALEAVSNSMFDPLALPIPAGIASGFTACASGWGLVPGAAAFATACTAAATVVTDQKVELELAITKLNTLKV